MPDDAPAPAPAPAPTPAPAATWFDGFDEETKQYINTRGLAEKQPHEAFLEAAKAHRSAEAYIGVPKEQLLKLPKADAAPEEWDAVWTQLGWSKNAADYALEGLKFADGTDVEDGFKDFVRTQAAALHLSPKGAADLAANTLAFLDTAEKATAAEDQATAARAAEQLRQSWGPNYDANKVTADRAYAALAAAANFDQATMTKAIQQLGDVTGKVEAMQLLLAVGQKIGEDSFVGGGPAGGPNRPLTKEGAIARIEALKTDTAWSERFLKGGQAETKEFADLHALAYADA